MLPGASALLYCLRSPGLPGHRRRPRPDLSTGQSGSYRPCRCAASTQRRPLRRSGPASRQCVGLARRPSRAVAVYHSMLTAGTHLAAEGLAAEAGAGRHTPSANAARHQLTVRSSHRGGAYSKVPRMTGRRGPCCGALTWSAAQPWAPAGHRVSKVAGRCRAQPWAQSNARMPRKGRAPGCSSSACPPSLRLSLFLARGSCC